MAPFGRSILCTTVLIIGFGLARAADGLPENVKTPKLHSTTQLAQAKLKPLRDQEVNLLAPEQGGQALVVPDLGWLKVISGKEEDYARAARGQSAVFAFKDERPATFWKFSVLITGESSYNPKQIEVLAGRDSPTGEYQSIGKLEIVNARMIKFPYQEVSFAETTAKYLKITILEGYWGGDLSLNQIRLLGSPVQ